MKTYNTNPGYEMDPQLLTHFNQHLDSLFGIYSKLLPFRMDFAYRKNTLSYRCACRYAMCAEILRLINEVGEKLVGYAWVMEYTERRLMYTILCLCCLRMVFQWLFPSLEQPDL